MIYQNKCRKSVDFWWVPGYTDVPDSEVAIAAAREAVTHAFCHVNDLWAAMIALVFFWLVFYKARQMVPYR
jgi:hypothetical protein